MVQTAITDGGIVSQPYHYFHENESTYRFIEHRLDRTREAYLNASKKTRIQLLFDSATYALLTANTPLPQADKSFRIYREHFPDIDPDRLGKAFAENGIGFHNRKSTYIKDNLDQIEGLFPDVDACLVSGDGGDAQQMLMDARGVGPAKSAFSLAMLGFTEHACIDTHVSQYLGIDPKVYERYDASEYKKLVDKLFSKIPDLRGEISPFLLQWLVFDINRGEIETHDMWFEHVARLVI